MIGKAAYEAKFLDRDIHIEGFGLYRQIIDRSATGANYVAAGGSFATQTNASNRTANGWGVGGGLIVPVLPRKLDFQVSGMLGRGIGTYSSGQMNDATFNPDGSPKPLREQTLLAGVIAHVTPSIDVYGFAGVEQIQGNYYGLSGANSNTATTLTGYGSPTGNNSECFNTTNATPDASVLGAGGAGNNLPGAGCNGNTKRLWELTGGVWDKLYKGSFGEVRVGVQYEYIQRELFQGNQGTAPYPALRFSPHQNENVVMTSFRYYPFQ